MEEMHRPYCLFELHHGGAQHLTQDKVCDGSLLQASSNLTQGTNREQSGFDTKEKGASK